MKIRVASVAASIGAVGLLFLARGSCGADPGGVSGQISAVESQVTTLEGQVTTLQGQVTSLEGQVTGLQSSNTALSSAISSLQSSNAALVSAISSLQSSVGGAGSPGQVLWTYYETTEAFTLCGTTGADSDGCNVGGNGDNIIRLVNPNGSASGSFGTAAPTTVCAMIYVFDDDQEMGECCGCPLSPTQVATFSVLNNLTANWGLVGGPEGGDHRNGSIAIVATAPNATPNTSGPGCNAGGAPTGGAEACNGGCDPTNTPGYSVTSGNPLLGNITHNQQVLQITSSGGGPTTGLTEVGLSDDRAGDPTNLTYLRNLCGAIVGNGTHAAICTCPTE